MRSARVEMSRPLGAAPPCSLTDDSQSPDAAGLAGDVRAALARPPEACRPPPNCEVRPRGPPDLTPYTTAVTQRPHSAPCQNLPGAVLQGPELHASGRHPEHVGESVPVRS